MVTLTPQLQQGQLPGGQGEAERSPHLEGHRLIPTTASPCRADCLGAVLWSLQRLASLELD